MPPRQVPTTLVTGFTRTAWIGTGLDKIIEISGMRLDDEVRETGNKDRSAQHTHTTSVADPDNFPGFIQECSRIWIVL
jgi:hypothetical protein